MCFLDFRTSIWVTENAVGVGHEFVTQRPFHSWMSSPSALTSRTGWVSVHKTIQFTSKLLVALLITAKAWRQLWDLETNVSESVWQFQWLSLLLCISFNFWNILSGWCVVARSENMSQITILEIDYTDITTRLLILYLFLFRELFILQLFILEINLRNLLRLMYLIMLSFIYFNFWHVHYTVSIHACVQKNSTKKLISYQFDFPAYVSRVKPQMKSMHSTNSLLSKLR